MGRHGGRAAPGVGCGERREWQLVCLGLRQSADSTLQEGVCCLSSQAGREEESGGGRGGMMLGAMGKLWG